MKKSFFVILPLLAILLLATGCGKQTAGPAEENKPVGEALSGSIADLLAKGRSIRCDLAAKADDAITSGTTYVANGKFRSDYKMKVAGSADILAYSLSDGTWLFSWSDAYPEQAAKFKMADLNQTGTKTEAEQKGTENYNAKFDYKCFDWPVDESLFVPPTGITFKDYSAILQQAKEAQQRGSAAAGSTVDKSTMCKSCDALQSQQAKDGCRKSLGC